MTAPTVHSVSNATSLANGRDARFRLYRSLLLAVVLLGIVFRVVQYAWKTSLWHDEALVTLNVMHSSYGELLRPLDYEQAAPPLFLWGEKWMLTHFGFGEYQLRLISVLCGSLSVPLFALLAWRLFAAPIALCTAALFAFCDKLIWHSAEVKQYGPDVFVAVLFLFLAIGWRRPVSFIGRTLLIAVLAAALVWFSFPAIFVFGGVSLVLLARLVRRGPPWSAAEIAAWVSGNLLVACSFSRLYVLSVRGHAAYLDDYWREHFANWHRPLLVPVWILQEIYRLCDHPYRSFGWLVLPAAILGSVFLYRTRRANVMWACLGPIALCFVAALAQKYPFTGERITIFLAPSLFILVGAGTEAIRGSPQWRRFWSLVPLPMIVYGLVLASIHLFQPQARSAIRPVVAYVRAHRAPGEAICLVGEGTSENAAWVSGRNLELLCYWPDVPEPVYPKVRDLGDVRERRFWIVYAALPKHGSRYMGGLLREARSISTAADKYEISGGGAILFEKR